MNPDSPDDLILYPQIEDLLKALVGGPTFSSKVTVLKSILEEMKEAVVIAGLDGASLYVNRAAKKIFGQQTDPGDRSRWSQDLGIYRMDGTTLFPPEELPLARALRGESTDEVEMLLRNANLPEGLFLSVRGRPIRGDQGEVKGGIVFCQDITGFKREQVRAQRLADLVAFTPVGVIQVTPDARIVSWNTGAEKIYGYRAEEIVGRHYTQLVPTYKVPLMQEQIQQLLRGEPVESHETVRTRKDGQTIVTWCSACTLYDENHQVRGFLLTTRDITHRQPPALDDFVPEAIMILSTEAVVAAWNPGAVKIFGYPKDEAKGRPLKTFFIDEVWEDIRKLVELADAGKEFNDFNSLAQNKNGDILNVTFSISPCKNKEGQVMGLTVVIRDVTQMRLAERLASEWKSIVDHSEEGVARDDLNGLIRYWNKGCEKIYGYRAEEVLGKPFSMFIGEGMVNDFPQIVGYIRSGHSSQYEAVRVRKDGKPIHVAVTLVPIRDKAGRVTEASVFIRDNTQSVKMREDLKRQEERLFQVQKMEALGRMAFGVAHDFNNLLTAIKGNSQLLLGEENLGEMEREAIENINDAALRATDLTRQLLLFGREKKSDPRVVDLNHLVSEEGKMLQRIIPREIQLRFDLDSKLPRIEADVTEIRQVLINLVLNARDAMPKGGEVVLQTRLWDSSGTGPDGEPLGLGRFAWLSVRDTGTGMDAETQKHIFEPFFTTKEKDKGTGLGLAIVYEIVQKSGGWISLESEPGKGTTFHLGFPAKISS